ncbi:MAG: type VI secretion system baseplate subunit TssF [Spirochaetaceae bacterium]|jgi:type VI secretion system VasI/ImpG family protein|nr:type VI secretion system baseplate subunit TssF [Spirochaetaceae bacterium]
MELLDYYRDNLAYIRNLALEFAAEFPKIAGRLGLSGFECEDPYIERLLEGTAFLSARVEKKLDDSYKNFLESVLNSISPSSLYPIPSGAVLELHLNYNNENVKKGSILPCGALLDAVIPTINTPCRFSTLEDVPIVPLTVTGAGYITRSLSDLGINERQGLAGLRIQLSAEGDLTPAAIERLCFYINLSDADASLLLRQILHETVGVYVRTGENPFKRLSGADFEMPLAYGGSFLFENLKSNAYGLKLLQNFLAYPAFFKFFTVKNIDAAFHPPSKTAEMIFVFNRREYSLSSVNEGALRLNCAPAVNLFAKRSDRVTMERGIYEFHVVPDKTAPRDYEVVNIHSIEFFNEQNETLFLAYNFYDDNPFMEKAARNFFSQRRRKSLVNPKVTRRSSYDGAEMFVSFSAQDKKMEDAYQFAAETVCTNRDLPLLAQVEAPLGSRSPMLTGASFITRPTRPCDSLMEQNGVSAFSRLSHIIFNLSAMFWQNGDIPLEALRALIASYQIQQIRSGEEMERMLEGISALERESASFRFIKNGAVFFERGWRVKFTLDESAFAGVGCYTFGKILAELLKSFTPVNSLLEIHFLTKQSGLIAVWKTLED